ncbi:MAG: hypothetical protein M3Q36_01445 [bacterium]|nr:hypothetical protein [bacterium]
MEAADKYGSYSASILDALSAGEASKIDHDVLMKIHLIAKSVIESSYAILDLITPETFAAATSDNVVDIKIRAAEGIGTVINLHDRAVQVPAPIESITATANAS